MKTFRIIFLLLVLISIFSCNDNTVKSLPPEVANTIKLIDSISNNQIQGYKIELFFVLKLKPIVWDNDFSLSPNPVINQSIFQFSLEKASTVELAITNIISNKEFVITNSILPPGTHALNFNSNDYPNIEYGFYKALLHKFNYGTDTVNMLYCTLEQYKNIALDTLYPVMTNSADLNGALKVQFNTYKLIGQTFYRTAESGQFLAGYEFTDNFRIKVYDKDNREIKELTLDADKVKNGFNIKI